MWDCDCPRCDVSKTTQVKFGLLLGYRPCCIDYHCHVLPYKFKMRDFGKFREEPFMDWFEKERVKARLGRLYAMSDYISLNFAKVGLSEVFPCFDCRIKVLKHVYKTGDWESALEIVVSFEDRVFTKEEDPDRSELLEAVDKRWGGSDVDELIKANPTEIFEILLWRDEE